MPTINAILRELKNVPVDKLEDLYSIIHSLRADVKKTGDKRNDILSYAGSFADLSEKDYSDFIKSTQETRDKLFDRNSDS